MKSRLITLAALATLAFTIGMAAPAEAAQQTAQDSAVQCRMAIAEAHDAQWFTLRVTADQIVTIGLRGDGDTDLDLYVYDERGRLIAFDINPTDRALLQVHSPINQTLRIEVRNLGRVWNAFALCIA